MSREGMMDCLCIGGVLDGKFHKSQGNRIKAVKPLSIEAIKPPEEIVRDNVQLFYETYRLEIWKGETRKFEIYILDDLSIDDAMEKLITNYRGEQNEP